MPLPADLLEKYKIAFLRPDFQPQTTTLLYEGFFKFVESNHAKGHSIIEIGCYKGSSSISLAYLCKTYGWPFYTIDISPESIDYTRNLLTEVGLADHTTFFNGTMEYFVQKIKLTDRPLLVFVDGDHRYKSVVADIMSIMKLKPRPYALAFHDFSLRSSNPEYSDVRVDDAILDTLGHHTRYLRIGDQITAQSPFTEDHPAPTGEYWQVGGTEGVIIEMDLVYPGYQFLRRCYAWLRHKLGR